MNVKTTKEERTRWIKEKALDFGFSAIGISRAEFMEDEANRLKEWLNLEYHGKMDYMENHFEKRTDPRLLVEDAQSVISLMYNYYNPDNPTATGPKISMYALGKDYHKVIKKKLKHFFMDIEEQFGAFKGRYFVDSAPILERDWAKRSGLGWIGKNTLLISPQKGSYFFLCEMIVDFELNYDEPIKDYCGTCTKCIDACPTDAIQPNGYVMDGSKCISYLTIELKSDIPVEFRGSMSDYIFGCDICQDVCPWNRFSQTHNEKDFYPEKLGTTSDRNWNELTEEDFNSLFEGSAVRRTGYKGLKRNINFISKTQP